MTYSADFRKRALEYMDEGHSYKELYDAFKVYPSAIEDWRELLAKTGSLEPQYKKTRRRKIDPAKLQQAIEEKPDQYLRELAESFNCTKQAIFSACKRNKLTYKKNLLRIQRSQKKNAKPI